MSAALALLARRLASRPAAGGLRAASCLHWSQSASTDTSCGSHKALLWTSQGEQPSQLGRPAQTAARAGLWALSPGFAARGISTGPAGGERQDAPQQQSGNGSGYAKNPLQQAAAQQIEGEIDGDSASPRLAVCHSRELRISPRKLNMAAKLVRKMHVKDALVNMSIRGEKKAAKMVKEAIRSAYFNAINNHSMDGNKLTVAECYVGRGRHLKRLALHAMGKTGRMEKYRAHLTVKLAESESSAPKTRVIRPLLERLSTKGNFDVAEEPLPKAGLARWTP